MSKKDKNMNIERRKTNIIHNFLKLAPQEQQFVLDKIKEISFKSD